MLTSLEISDLKERFDAADPLGNKMLEHCLELRAFLADLVQHLDSPGPSPEKTADYYQLAARARRLGQTLNP